MGDKHKKMRDEKEKMIEQEEQKNAFQKMLEERAKRLEELEKSEDESSSSPPSTQAMATSVNNLDNTLWPDPPAPPAAAPAVIQLLTRKMNFSRSLLSSEEEQLLPNSWEECISFWGLFYRCSTVYHECQILEK